MKFKDKVTKLFPDVDEYKEVESDRWHDGKSVVTFVVRRADFTAEKLFELSDVLGTGTIEIKPEVRYGGYCSTCSYEYGVMEMTAVGVDLG